MKIFNIMFQKTLGGLEQSFLDYHKALSYQGFEAVAIIHPNAEIRRYLKDYKTIYNYNKYDIIALYKLYSSIRKDKPNCIITHGGRAANLMRYVKVKIPHIAVSHNYNFKSIMRADAIITLTENMRDELAKTSLNSLNCPIYILPNMISIEHDKDKIIANFRNPPIIGIISRFSTEKGIDVVLKALRILKLKNIPFKAKFAGDGELKHSIQNMISSFGLTQEVELLGWIDNKSEFYNSIDIFCSTSYEESFGISILEAFKHAKPSIITSTPGPLEMATNNVNALFVPVGDYNKVAESLIELIYNQDKAKSLAKQAYHRAQDYSIHDLSAKLRLIIEEVCSNKLKIRR